MKNIRRAFDFGNSSRSIRIPPDSPTSISGMFTNAFSEAIMMSQNTISAYPAPIAGPFTAAITGFAHSLIE